MFLTFDSVKQHLKKLLPNAIHRFYNRVVSRRLIQKRRGDWFDVDWNRRAPEAGDREWINTYESSWQAWQEPDLTPDDLRRVAAEVGRCESVLDAGCGDGYLLEALQEKGDRIAGVDLSLTALRRARERLGGEAQLTQAFLEALPFGDNAFDVVVSAHTLEHVKRLSEAVAELKRVARRRLVVLVPCQEYLLYTDDYHLHYFPDKKSLLDVIAMPRARCQRYTVQKADAKFAGEVLLLTAELQT